MFATEKAAKLTTTQRIGPRKSIPVVQGDKIQAKAFAYYTTNSTTNSYNQLNLFINANPGYGSSTNAQGEVQLPAFPLSNISVGVGITTAPPTQPAGVPNAYLALIHYNESNTVVAQQYIQISTLNKNTWANFLQTTEYQATTKGRIEIFVANESNVEVWFDDLEIRHKGAIIAQEIHYDPWGLELVGVGKAGLDKFTFNAQSEKQRDLADGKGYFYETDFRGYDAQIGRFHGYDLLASAYSGISPYQFAFNNPIGFNDPTGLESIDWLIGKGKNEAEEYQKQVENERKKEKNNEALRQEISSFVENALHKKKEYTYDFGGEEEEDLHWEAGEHGGKCPVCGKESCSCSSNNKRTWGGFILDVVQGGLDLVDLSETPIISQAAAVSNAGISYLRGDKFGAGVSMAGIFIPGITAIKYAKKVDDIAIGAANAGKKLPMGVPSLKNAKFDWEEIMSGHSDWGVRGIQSGKKTVFEGLDENQIKDVVKGAYDNIYKHEKLINQENKYKMVGEYNGWTIEFIVNTKTKIVETAYPKKK